MNFFETSILWLSLFSRHARNIFNIFNLIAHNLNAIIIFMYTNLLIWIILRFAQILTLFKMKFSPFMREVNLTLFFRAVIWRMYCVVYSVINQLIQAIRRYMVYLIKWKISYLKNLFVFLRLFEQFFYHFELF